MTDSGVQVLRSDMKTDSGKNGELKFPNSDRNPAKGNGFSEGCLNQPNSFSRRRETHRIGGVQCTAQKQNSSWALPPGVRTFITTGNCLGRISLCGVFIWTHAEGFRSATYHCFKGLNALSAVPPDFGASACQPDPSEITQNTSCWELLREIFFLTRLSEAGRPPWRWEVPSITFLDRKTCMNEGSFALGLLFSVYWPSPSLANSPVPLLWNLFTNTRTLFFFGGGRGTAKIN